MRVKNAIGMRCTWSNSATRRSKMSALADAATRTSARRATGRRRRSRRTTTSAPSTFSMAPVPVGDGRVDDLAEQQRRDQGEHGLDDDHGDEADQHPAVGPGQARHPAHDAFGHRCTLDVRSGRTPWPCAAPCAWLRRVGAEVRMRALERGRDGAALERISGDNGRHRGVVRAQSPTADRHDEGFLRRATCANRSRPRRRGRFETPWRTWSASRWI